MNKTFAWILAFMALVLTWIGWASLGSMSNDQAESFVQRRGGFEEAEVVQPDAAAEASSEPPLLLWVALVGLAGIVVGGGVGAILVLRKPRTADPLLGGDDAEVPLP